MSEQYVFYLWSIFLFEQNSLTSWYKDFCNSWRFYKKPTVTTNIYKISETWKCNLPLQLLSLLLSYLNHFHNTTVVLYTKTIYNPIISISLPHNRYFYNKGKRSVGLLSRINGWIKILFIFHSLNYSHLGQDNYLCATKTMSMYNEKKTFLLYTHHNHCKKNTHTQTHIG